MRKRDTKFEKLVYKCICNWGTNFKEIRHPLRNEQRRYVLILSKRIRSFEGKGQEQTSVPEAIGRTVYPSRTISDGMQIPPRERWDLGPEAVFLCQGQDSKGLSWRLAAANTNGSASTCQRYGNLSGTGPLVWGADPSRTVSTPRLSWMFSMK